MVRPPAVAGRFYPGNPETLSRMLAGFVDASCPRRRALGIVVPHAGYVYSGAVAGAVYSRVQIPSRAIVLCPNHSGMGVPLAIMRRGAWETPLGQLQIDDEMCDALMAADPDLEDDMIAHRLEHALEVQLPFLQFIEGAGVRFVPITVGTSRWEDLERLGKAIGDTVARVDSTALIIASSDMNHYESDALTRVKDAKAIDPMLKLDARALYETVLRERISMCGFGPATAMIVAARSLGATRAELVRYATSGDVSRDFDRVVGYAGIFVE
jgi:AmmeMemoRadiSam system protein B